MSLAALLTRIIGALDLAGVPHMIAGSVASTLHGVARTTQDVDLVIDPTPRTLRAFLEVLAPDAYYVDADAAMDALRRRSMFNLIDLATGWKVDCIIRKDRAFSVEELARRQPVDLAGVRVQVATAEDVIVSKLEWAKASGSERQLDDVAGVLAVRGAALDVPYVERWVQVLGLDAEWARARARALDV